MAEENTNEGLGNKPKSEWPDNKVDEDKQPIDVLRPGSEQHRHVLEYLKNRIKFSEDEMEKFYARWQVSEKKYQAYISLPDWEQELKQMNDKGAPPKAVSITVPYNFATIQTIVTYLIHTFAGRRPMFQVTSRKAETMENARMMEMKIQYDAEHSRLIKHLFQFFHDGQLYGLGVLRTMWSVEKRMRTKWIDSGETFAGEGGEKVKQRTEEVAYEGNEVAAIDPYKFLPDPRVPMTEVNRQGEFVFWKSKEGRHKLKSLEKQGLVKYVNAIQDKQQDYWMDSGLESERSLVAKGSSEPANPRTLESNDISRYVEVHQGTVEIIPAELGLGDSEYPEKWLFTVANKNTIIQAEPLALDHDMHPVAVIEPYTMGYSFGQPGMADYLNPLQDTLSWFINSHVDNVRTALNNMFIVDPSRVELQDLKEPGAGKIIRMKRSASGQDVRGALSQLPVADVTTNHVKDFQLLMGLGDALSSITDNLRGLQDSGGRKTATEVRTSNEASASRLAAQSRLISAQAIVDLTEMMSLNNQQNLSEEFYLEFAGQDGIDNPLRISPQNIVGDFHYPIHDGTLPLDKVALLDVWREIFQGVSQDQELRQNFDLIEMFKHISELGGAKNIEQFIVQGADGEELARQAQAGNAVPLNEAGDLTGGSSQTPGTEASPQQRVQQ